jgi:hypothetical protein
VDLRLAFLEARTAWIDETEKYSITRNTETRLWCELLAARRDFALRFLKAAPEDVRRAALYFHEEE